MRQDENEVDTHIAEGFEIYPEFGALRAPDKFVQQGDGDEENGIVACQGAPCRVGQIERQFHDHLDIKLPPHHADQKRQREEAVDHRKLHFDEGFVLQVQRQPPHHHHNKEGEFMHGANVAQLHF